MVLGGRATRAPESGGQPARLRDDEYSSFGLKAGVLRATKRVVHGLPRPVHHNGASALNVCCSCIGFDRVVLP